MAARRGVQRRRGVCTTKGELQRPLFNHRAEPDEDRETELRGQSRSVNGGRDERQRRHEQKESDYHCAEKGEGRVTLIRPDLNDRSVRNKVPGSSVPDLAYE